MGYSATGILTYGVDLGGERDGWKIQDVDRWEEWRPSWLKPDEDGDYAEASYEDDAMRALLAAAGFTETDWEAEGYSARKRAAEQRVGVEFTLHGHYEGCRELALTTFVYSESGRGPTLVDPDVIATAPTELWDGRIEDALRVLGIKPMQENPGWLLTSWYG